MTNSLDQFAQTKLDEIAARDLTRTLGATERGPGARARRQGREAIAFCDNDYLGLSQHPDVIAAAVAATEALGAGAGASRLVTGNAPLYAEVEERIARIKGSETAIVFGSGYLANIGIIPNLVGRGDAIIGDELMHACMHAGSRLSGADLHLFRHNDATQAREQLAALRAGARHCLILTEGVFSMDGDRAPVAALAAAAREFDAWLLVDDAHAFGVINGGRGSGFEDPHNAVAVDLRMGTLSKAVGAYGGYLAASRPVIELMVNRARSLIYTTGLPPGTLAAAAKGLELMETDAQLTAVPLARSRQFTAALGLPEAQSAIVPLLLGSERAALDASAALEEQGFLVTAIRPPTVPKGTARLRFTFSAAHSEAQVAELADSVSMLGLAGDRAA